MGRLALKRLKISSFSILVSIMSKFLNFSGQSTKFIRTIKIDIMTIIMMIYLEIKEGIEA